MANFIKGQYNLQNMLCDVLFIHIPRLISKSLTINLIPIGIFSIADFISNRGISTKILHMGIEQELNAKFDVAGFIKENNISIICLDLHWHHSAHVTLKEAERIKGMNPDCKIVLGGNTSSFFSKEILQEYSFIDYIVRGDGEIPLFELVKQLKGNSDLSKVPNLSWREGCQIIQNNQTFVADQNLMNNLSFTNFSLLQNYERYLNYFLDEIIHNKRVIYFNCGRGCPVNCSFCAGSNISQKIINNRIRPELMSYWAVIRELKNMEKFGINCWYTCFDPYPHSDYYATLFKKIRDNDIKLNLYFECWSLPSKEFIDEFSGTFLEDSTLIISPETGSNKVRNKNKGYFYSNKQLLSILNYIEEKGVNCILSFAAGLPFETKEDIFRTFVLIHHIKRNYKKIEFTFSSIALEPASPIYLKPSLFEVISERSSFDAFCSKDTDLGYHTDNLTKEEINAAIELMKIEANSEDNMYSPFNILKSRMVKNEPLNFPEILQDISKFHKH